MEQLLNYQIKYYRQLMLFQHAIMFSIIFLFFIGGTLFCALDFVIVTIIDLPLLPPINALMFFIIFYLLFSIFSNFVAKKIASFTNPDGTVTLVRREQNLLKMYFYKFLGK